MVNSTGGTVALRSSSNTDAKKTKADGTEADASTVGIGAAVAINDVNITNRASTGVATVNAQALDVEATMTNVSGDLTHSIDAEADSGATGDTKVSLAGALAINIVHNTTEAVVPSGSHLAIGSGNITLKAQSTEEETANATSTAKGGSVGVGASVALNILTSTTTRAEVEDGATLSMSGANVGTVSLAADSSRTVTTTVSAGSKGDVSVTPAVALVIDNGDHTTARLGSGPGGILVASGSVTVQATHTGDFTNTKADASAAGSSAAIGADAAINIVQDWTTTGEMARSTSGASVTIGATSTMTSSPQASASASGGDSSDQSADKKAR